MNTLGATVYLALAQRLALLLLATVRLAPLAFVTPLLGGRALPPQARAVLLAVLALGVYPAALRANASAPSLRDPLGLATAALHEVSVGLVIALVIAVPFAALEHAGRTLDVARGANAAEVTAPDTGARSSPLAELLRWTFTVTFLSAGGLRAVLRVVATSFELAPLATPGPAGSLHTGRLAEQSMRAAATSLSSGLLLASSGLVALLAVELALAVASRIAPALAHSQVALPVRALAPLAVVALAASVITGGAHELGLQALAIARLVAP